MPNSGIDSGKAVVQFTQSTLNQIASLKTTIDAAAAAANVSPDSIAAPMAREINKYEAGDYQPPGSSVVTSLPAISDAVKNTIAVYGTLSIRDDATGSVIPPLTEQEYQANLQFVIANNISSTQSSGTVSQIVTRLDNPVLNDLGIAKIKLETAMEAVSYYNQNPSEFGTSDTLNLQKYAGNTPQLVADLINRTTTGDVSVALQAVIARQADNWAAGRIDGWSGYSDAQKAAFTAAMQNGSYRAMDFHSGSIATGCLAVRRPKRATY